MLCRDSIQPYDTRHHPLPLSQEDRDKARGAAGRQTARSPRQIAQTLRGHTTSNAGPVAKVMKPENFSEFSNGGKECFLPSFIPCWRAVTSRWRSRRLPLRSKRSLPSRSSRLPGRYQSEPDTRSVRTFNSNGIGAAPPVIVTAAAGLPTCSPDKSDLKALFIGRAVRH